MRSLWAIPGFTRLFLGVSTSSLGDSVMLLVLSMWVKTLTDSNAMAGLTFLFMVLPSLFAPALGILIDRIRRKPLLVWGNIASALALLPLLAVRSAEHVWIIWTVAFLYGVSFVVLPAALNGLLKEIVPDDRLVDANGAIQTVKEGYRLFGPLVGAALFGGFGGWVVTLVDIASFLVAAGVIASIPLRENAPEMHEHDVWSQLTAGVRHLAADRILRHCLIGFGLMLLVIGFAESTIYAILDAFGQPVTFAGYLVTVQGVGALLGGITANKVVRRLGEPATLVLAQTILAMGVVLIAVAPSMAMALPCTVIVGLPLPWLFVAFMTLMQRRTPQHLMGRVSTAVEVVMGTPQAISLMVGAMLVTVLSYRVVWSIMAAVILTGAAYIAWSLRDTMTQGAQQGLRDTMTQGAQQGLRDTMTQGAQPSASVAPTTKDHRR